MGGERLDYQFLDDQALIRLVAQAQTEALSALYDRYGRLVFSMALNTVGDHSLAEEITQDVYMRVWEKAHTYQAEYGKVVTWITSIARYRAIDVLRHQRARPEGHRAAWEDSSFVEGMNSGLVEEAVESLQQKQRIRQAIAQLPEGQRLALSMAFFQGYSHSEISAAINEPLGTVKTRIRLAMQKLREALYDEQVPSREI